jgi:hypothetical protein
MVQCPLDVARTRKELPQKMQARGAPALLIIRENSPNHADRLIRNGQAIFFVATRHDEERTRGVEPSRSRQVVSREPAVPPAPASIWRIETFDSSGGALAIDSLLLDASFVRLRNPSAAGYLRLVDDAQSISPLGQATSFTLFKADVPDSTRPTTCDAQIRDADFVFVQSVAPRNWIGVSDAGELLVRHFPITGQSSSSQDIGYPVCAQEEEERCLNDKDGELVCAWAPLCAN